MRITPRLAVLWLVAAGLAVYANSLAGVFVLDDLTWIGNNARICQLWPPGRMFSGTSRPLLQATLALNYAASGLAPWSYHVVNLAIHLLAGLTLWAILRRTLRPWYDQAADGLACASAFLWLIHPLQTESVTYVIQRSESLAGLLFLFALFAVIRGAAAGPGQRRWELLAILASALGLACKATLVIAPVLILLYDRVFLAGSVRGAWRARWPLYLGLAASWLLLPPLLAAGATEWKNSAGFGFGRASPPAYALTQLAVIAHYLKLCVWPHPLCFDYAWPISHRLAEVGWPGLVTVAGLAITAGAWNKSPAWGFLGLWFFLTLLPTSSFVPVADVAVEHRMYLPLAAVATGAVLGLYTMLGSRTWLGVVLLGGAGLGLGWQTIQRNQDYHSGVTLWRDTARQRPQNPRAQINLGVVLAEAGQPLLALPHLERALELNHAAADAHYNLGATLTKLGRRTEALAHYQQAVQLQPDLWPAQYNLALLLADAGHPREAEAHYRAALAVAPEDADTHYNLGRLLEGLDQPQAALEQYTAAVRLNSHDPQSQYNLAHLLAAQGRAGDAEEHYRRTLQLDPADVKAEINLANLYLERGAVALAIQHYSQAVRLAPSQAEAHLNLAVALTATGQLEAARKEYQTALRLAQRAGNSALAASIQQRLTP